MQHAGGNVRDKVPQGAPAQRAARTSSKALRKFDSDSPASFDMISGPLIKKKKAPVSFATARAISVLPEPGGPKSRIPRGGFTPIDLKSCERQRIK